MTLTKLQDGCIRKISSVVLCKMDRSHEEQIVSCKMDCKSSAFVSVPNTLILTYSLTP